MLAKKLPSNANNYMKANIRTDYPISIHFALKALWCFKNLNSYKLDIAIGLCYKLCIYILRGTVATRPNSAQSKTMPLH